MGKAAWLFFLSAVEAALPTDEGEWVEWKGSLDLNGWEHLAKIAICIIAMANRDPDGASHWFSGFGVVIVGLEPANVHGIEPRDPAELEDAIGRLLGEDGPSWEPRFIDYRTARCSS